MRRITQFREVVRRDGALTGFQLIALSLADAALGEDRAYHLRARLTDAVYDWRHRTDTGGKIALSDIGVDARAGRHYLGCPPRPFRLMMSHIPVIPSEFTFVDLGCGKGRALLLAAEFGFRRLIGVDVSAELLRFAKQNTQRIYSPPELVLSNAADFQFPIEPLVVFMFNPFFEDVMRQVAANLEAAANRSQRPLYVALWRPALRRFYDNSGCFGVVAESEVRYPWYVIYRAESDSCL